MSYRFQRGGLIVRCDVCPGQPILPTRCEIDTGRCVRCQDGRRRLPVPHPEDHLCAVCGRECPECGAPTRSGGPCHRCRRQCRNCGSSLPERTAGEVTFVEPEDRKDRSRRWRRAYWPTTLGVDLCDDCRKARSCDDPVRAVLAALPDKLLRAGDGTTSPTLRITLQAELRHRSPEQLAARIERRWFATWAHRPLSRTAGNGQAGYGPDDVALWLLSPTDCPARCEDGWDVDDSDRRCPTCQSTSRPVHSAPGVTSPAAARSVSEASSARPPQRECEGRDGACGVPVAPPYTQCPSCLGWPTCRCGRRYCPSEGACRACGSTLDQGL